MQRARAYDDFEDDRRHWEQRPSLWLEPQDDWSEGAVTLLEIPSDSELNENVFAYWRPKAKLAKGGDDAVPLPSALVEGMARSAAAGDRTGARQPLRSRQRGQSPPLRGRFRGRHPVPAGRRSTWTSVPRPGRSPVRTDSAIPERKTLQDPVRTRSGRRAGERIAPGVAARPNPGQRDLAVPLDAVTPRHRPFEDQPPPCDWTRRSPVRPGPRRSFAPKPEAALSTDGLGTAARGAAGDAGPGSGDDGTPAQVVDRPGRAGEPLARAPRVFGGAVALTAYGGWQMVETVSVSGSPTGLQLVLVVLFCLTFSWIALAFTSAVLGFGMLLRRPRPSTDGAGRADDADRGADAGLQRGDRPHLRGHRGDARSRRGHGARTAFRLVRPVGFDPGRRLGRRGAGLPRPARAPRRPMPGSTTATGRRTIIARPAISATSSPAGAAITTTCSCSTPTA